MEIYLFLVLCSLKEITDFRAENWISILSFLISIIFVQLSLAAFALICVFLFKNNPHKENYGKFDSIYDNLSKSKLARRRFRVMFLLRRTGIIITIVFISNGYYQYGVYLALNCMNLVYFLLKLPFKNQIDNLLYIVTDIGILIL